MTKLVTAIIPTYNRARQLQEALHSVRTQSYWPIETIVVDDGSTDGTRNVVTHIEGVTYVRQSNQGPASARNAGIGLSHGDYVAFLDSDDIWHKDKIRTQVAAMEQLPFAAFCHTSYNANGKVIHSGKLSGYVYPRIIGKCTVACSSVIVRRSALTCGFPENIRIGEDVVLWSRLARMGIVIGIDQPLTNVAVHSNSVSQDRTAQVIGRRNIINHCIKKNDYLTITERLWLTAKLEASIAYYRLGVVK